MRKSAVVKLIEDLEKLKSLGIYASDINKDDTIETLAAKKGIKEKELITIGLDPKRKIWSNKWVVQQAYKGKGTAKPPSAEETNKLIELGVTFGKTKRKSAVEILIEDFEKLKSIGIDASDIKFRDTIGMVAEREGINEEELRSIGLDPEDKIGNRIRAVKQAYKGKGIAKPPSNEETNKLIELGVSFGKTKRKSAVEILIEDLEKLKSIGIDASDIKQRDTIGAVAERKEINEEEIRKIGLNSEDKIGTRINTVKQAYRGKGKVKPPTDEENRKLIELGVNTNKTKMKRTVREIYKSQSNEEIKEVIANLGKSKRKSATELLIEDLEKLKSIGIDASDIKFRDTIGIVAERKGISEENLRSIGLVPENKIGNRINRVNHTYEGKGTYKPLSNEEINKLIELGVNFGKKKSATVKLIENLEKLRSLGIYVSDIKQKDTIGTVAERKGISEVEIRKIGLNPDNRIGNRLNTLKQTYKGKGTNKPLSNAEINKFKKLGVNFDKRKSAVEILIEDLEKLRSLGIYASEIKPKDTISTVVEKKGISEEKLRSIGLNPKSKIGNRIKTVKQNYREKGVDKLKGHEKIKRLRELGVNLGKRKSAVAKLIEDLEKLRSLGIYVSDIKQKDTIGTVAEREGIREGKLISIGLDSENKIGNRINRVNQTYKGKEAYKPLSDEEEKKLIELGLGFGKRKIAVVKLIEDLGKLRSIGIYASDIKLKDTIGTVAKRKGISEEELRKIGVNPENRIGSRLNTLKQAYKRKGTNKPLTNAEINKFKELGVNFDKKKRNRDVAKLIEVLEKLRSIGIDASDIDKDDTLATLAIRYKISNEQIISLGLRLNEKIGNSIDTVRHIYNNRKLYDSYDKLFTKDEKRKLELLVLGRDRSRTGKEIAEASIGSLKQIEMSDKEYEIFKKLKEQEKENER